MCVFNSCMVMFYLNCLHTLDTMKWLVTCCFLSCLFVTPVWTSTMSDYQTLRAAVIEKEKRISIGGDIELNTAEIVLNEKLLKLKRLELDDVNYRPWTRNFIDVADKIITSEVFKFIKRVPKGASLHSHLFASASLGYVNDLLRRENIYICEIDGRIKLKFLPANTTGANCELLADKRSEPNFTSWLNAHLTLNSSDPNVWDSFKKIFTFTYDLFSFKGVFEDYVYQVLKEHHSDNVMYLEVRSPFVPMYDLSNTSYQPVDFVDALHKTVKEFKRKHPDFIGLKLIYAQYRRSNAEIVKANFDTLKSIIKKYPNFVAGVDFVGFEEDGDLLNYLDELKDLSDINFYFHAGETNKEGEAVDWNILDAILLDSKRIGHAYALPKHPELLKMVRAKSIAIEVCPISNQVLGLLTDLRNHPATHLIANGFPVVVCNDDPGNWNAEGLSYDWYLAFMAMSRADSGLELLKKLAMNSLHYSGLTETEKSAALEIWNGKWIQFVEDLNREL